MGVACGARLHGRDGEHPENLMGRVSDEVLGLVVRRNTSCTVGIAIDALADDDADELIDVMGRPVSVVPHAAVTRWLNAQPEVRAVVPNGFTDSTVGRHRLGKCACGTR